MRMTKGPEARLLFLAGRVTKLFKYERVELTYHQAVEVRGYAERVSYPFIQMHIIAIICASS